MFNPFKRFSIESGVFPITADPCFGPSEPDAAQRRRNRLATLVLLGTVTAFGVLVWQGLYGEDRSGPGGLCSNAVPSADVVFLIDATDPLSNDQLGLVAARVRQTGDSLPEGGHLSVMRLNPAGAAAPLHLLFEGCKPADGRSASAWTENARLLAGRYRESFVEPLGAAVAALSEPHPAETSPLIEALHALAPHLAAHAQSPRRELVIVSDMLQNSPLLSHFRKRYSFETLAKTGSVYLTDLAGLAGVEVTLYQLRDRYPDRQTAAHGRFWEAYFGAARVARFQVVGL